MNKLKKLKRSKKETVDLEGVILMVVLLLRAFINLWRKSKGTNTGVSGKERNITDFPLQVTGNDGIRYSPACIN